MSLALAKETVAETPEASKDHGQDAAAEDDFEKASAADDIETTAADEPAYRDGKDAEKGDVPSADHDGQEVIAAATPPPPHSIFPRSTKIFIVAMTVVSSLFSPFSNFCYIPALNVLAADLAGGSLAAIDFTVTSYQVLQGLAPMFFGDMADHAGRRPVYLLTFAIYLGANVGLALQRNYAALIVLRALQSTGSSATIAVGGIALILHPETSALTEPIQVTASSQTSPPQPSAAATWAGCRRACSLRLLWRPCWAASWRSSSAGRPSSGSWSSRAASSSFCTCC